MFIIDLPSGRKWEKVGNMFFGNYSHSLDDKGRLVIPRKMRDELGLKIFIMKGYDGALSIYKEESFVKLVEELERLSFNKKENRDYLRLKLTSVVDLDVDKMGRVQIPQALLAKYHIGKDVIVLGAGDHIEVWDMKKYEEYISSIEDKFEDIAERLIGD